jgi:hypothetical protein
MYELTVLGYMPFIVRGSTFCNTRKDTHVGHIRDTSKSNKLTIAIIL